MVIRGGTLGIWIVGRLSERVTILDGQPAVSEPDDQNRPAKLHQRLIDYASDCRDLQLRISDALQRDTVLSRLIMAKAQPLTTTLV